MSMTLTTKQVMHYLDEHVIGQNQAKHAIAIAHRERTLKILHGSKDVRWQYVTPNNLLMIGNSGCGKTACAKALAKMTNAPMVITSATEYTQVGYYGRDVKAIMSDLLKEAIRIAPKVWSEEQSSMNNDEHQKQLEKLKPVYFGEKKALANHLDVSEDELTWSAFIQAYTKNKLTKFTVPYKYKIDLIATIPVKTASQYDDQSSNNDISSIINNILGGASNLGGVSNTVDLDQKQYLYASELMELLVLAKSNVEKYTEILNNAFDSKTRDKLLRRAGSTSVDKRRTLALLSGYSMEQLKAWCDKLAVSFSLPIMSLINFKQLKQTKRDVPKEFIVKLVEERGIVFIDEFDKIFLDKDGGNVGNLGVVRDLMPFLDGVVIDVSTVPERESFMSRGESYRINTANILFIVAGAFQLAKVEDVPAEILGRLPVHVKLDALTIDDLTKIITKPHGSELTRIQLMMDAEGIDFQVTEGAIRAIAELVYLCNQKGENLGARRIINVMHNLFEMHRFNASDMDDQQIIIDRDYIEQMAPIILSRVIDRPETITPSSLKNPQSKAMARPD